MRSILVRIGNRIYVLVAAVTVALIGTAGGIAAASASTAYSQPTHISGLGNAVTGCVNGAKAKPYSYVPWRGIWQIYTDSANPPPCPSGSWRASMASESQLQTVNNAVTQNTRWISQNGSVVHQNAATLYSLGKVVAQFGNTSTTTLAGIGGSWLTRHTLVATSPKLSPGTYLVTLTGDFYHSEQDATDQTSATPVLQIQLHPNTAVIDRLLTGYTGAFPAADAHYGVDSNGAPNGLEQTAVATGVIKVTSAGTVDIDAFGYNAGGSGAGGGDFGVNAHADIVQLQG